MLPHAVRPSSLVLLAACAACTGNIADTDSGAHDAARVGDAAPAMESDSASPSDSGPAPTDETDGAAPRGPSDGGALGSDAASADAEVGSTNPDDFFGAPRCAAHDFLLCEDFESEASGAVADPALWETLGERILVDGTRAARGTRALHVVTRSNEALHFIRTTGIAAQVATGLWGRMFVWFESPRPTHFSHWTMFEATGTHPAGGTARTRFGGIHIPGVENRLDFNYDIWGDRPEGFHEIGRELEGVDTPDGTWHCFEWKLDVPAREARFFWNGREQAGLYFKDASSDGIPLDLPAIDGVNIGMAVYQDLGSDEWNLWIDEIAIRFEPHRLREVSLRAPPPTLGGHCAYEAHNDLASPYGLALGCSPGPSRGLFGGEFDEIV